MSELVAREKEVTLLDLVDRIRKLIVEFLLEGFGDDRAQDNVSFDRDGIGHDKILQAGCAG